MSVTVTGYGSAAAVPDTAVLRLAATHEAPTMTAALAGAESAREAVVAAIRRTTGGAAATIGSTGLSVWPATDHRGRPSGFTAEHSLVVRCAGLQDAGALVEAAVSAAGDRLRVQGVSLAVSDPAPALTAARDAAWTDARARAEHLAELAGAALGEVEQVVEGGGSGGSADGASGGGMMARSAKLDVSFEPGETTITTSVTVVFGLVRAPASAPAPA